MLVPVRTLSEMKRKFGEEQRRISYLKVDVEGSEIKAGPTQRNLSQYRLIGWLHLSCTKMIKNSLGLRNKSLRALTGAT